MNDRSRDFSPVRPEVFLNSLVNYEKVSGYNYDLEAYRKFLRKIGSPHEKLRNVILIAGTKGKGSTAAILSSCLIAHGFKVGLYTSPHLGRFNERIKVNHQEISDRDLQEYIKVIKPYVNMKNRIGARSFFEVLTAIAFLHFVRNDADFVVLEVGLGGRLDATNVTDPLISVITRIGFDHMNLLGSRLSQIANEKAGIIHAHHSVREPDISRSLRESETNKAIPNEIAARPLVARNDRHLYGRTAITVRQRPSVEKILKRTAGQCGNRLIFAESQHKAVIGGISLKGSRVHISGKLGSFKTFLPLVGKHQVENLLIVLAVLNELKKNGFNITPRIVKRGIEKTQLRGRFEVISKKPLTIYDVAHDEDSFRALEANITLLPKSCHCEESGGFYGGRRSNLDGSTKQGIATPLDRLGARNDRFNFYIIFGCSQDKDINYAVRHIFPKAREVLLVKADHPRAREPVDIFKKARKYQKNITIAGSCRRALEYLRAKKGQGPAIIVFGSFYLWNELKLSKPR